MRPASYEEAAQAAESVESQRDPDRRLGAPVSAGMTLTEFESFALQYNPSIRQAAAAAAKAEGTRRQVGLLPNPTVNYLGWQIGKDGTPGVQGGMVQQTIVTGHKLEKNEAVAEQDVQALRWQAESQRRRVLNDVRTQFFETLGAQERVKLTHELQQIAVEAAENARTLTKVGQAARPDLLQAEIQLQEIGILLRTAEFEREANWRKLTALAGVPGLTLAELENVLDAPQPDRDFQATLQQLLAASPQLQQARAEVQRARALIDRAKSQPIPNLTVLAGGAYLFPEQQPAANVQVGVPLPIFNRNQGNVDRAWAECHRAERNLERLQLALQSELAAAFQAYRIAQNRVTTYRDEIVPRQQETLKLIQEGYPAQFEYLRLLTARQSYYEARLKYLNSLVELRKSEVPIDGLLLTGGLDAVPDSNLDDALRGAALMGQ